MNSLILLLPAEVDAERISQLVRGLAPNARVEKTSAADGDRRVYWSPVPEIAAEYDPQEWASFVGLGTKAMVVWQFDYSGGIEFVRMILASMAAVWSSLVVDNDFDSPMTAPELFAQLSNDTAWDWRN